MYSHNEIIEHFYFQYFIIGTIVTSVQRYSGTLRYMLRYRITLYYSIANVIVSKRYRSWYIGTIIASYSYRSV